MAYFFIAAGIVAAVCAVVAVAAHRRARKALRSLRRHERAREEDLLERLAGGLAHELKNPLGTLNLNVQLLEEDLAQRGGLDPALKSRIASIAGDYRRLEEVLNNFLRYASRRQLALAEVDMNTLVYDLVTFLEGELRRTGVEIRTAPSPAAPVCRADAGLIKQALLNVMLNAIEAMPGGGSIEIATSREDGFARVTVRDTGVGIPPENLPRIFDAYFSRKQGGTGLGLAITKRIIEDHDGRITVESAPGKGATVTIELPVEGPQVAPSR